MRASRSLDLIPNPWLFLEATGQVFRGDSGDVFQSSKRGDLSYVGHLRGYHDLTESTNLDLGVSYAHGHNASGIVGGDRTSGASPRNCFGVDATFRWRPLRRAIYHSLHRPHRADRGAGGISRTACRDASGFYVSGDYQFARRWFTGARFDRSDRPTDASLHDSGESLDADVLAERVQPDPRAGPAARTTREGVDANEFLFQFQFAIGAHGAHPF